MTSSHALGRTIRRRTMRLVGNAAVDAFRTAKEVFDEIDKAKK